MIEGELHELTDGEDDVPHKVPNDHHSKIVWFFEPVKATGVLTQDGITQIAYHEYKAGTYTWLDTHLNPIWQRLTDRLPMHMAPNMVTTLGGLHCFVAYLVTWWYCDRFQNEVPPWILVLNAYCMIWYYTLDCMDGKQARRTGTSSPLGQLFDHGMDCLCLQQHNSMCMVWLCLTEKDALWFWACQATLQFSFYTAQWEEYYTGTLPHATGNLGVTEVNYGLAIVSLFNVLIRDRPTFYSQPLADWLPASLILESLPLEHLGIKNVQDFQLKHAAMLGWYCLSIFLCILSFSRVLFHLSTFWERFGAFSKLISPFLLSVAPFGVDSTILARELRWFSLAYGLALTQITIKLIVFSMAKQSFAAVQLKEVFPLTVLSYWIRTDAKWRDPGIRLVLQLVTFAYLIRILRWTASAIGQLTERLDVYLFTIKPKSNSSNQKKMQ
jgi:ethanolaminephosphotransferase